LNIEIKVIAGARRQEMKLEGSVLKVKLLSKPIKGKANEELIDFLARAFAVKRKDISILHGDKDTRKVVSVPIDELKFKSVVGG
jgi:uncharacterized protein